MGMRDSRSAHYNQGHPCYNLRALIYGTVYIELENTQYTQYIYYIVGSTSTSSMYNATYSNVYMYMHICRCWYLQGVCRILYI